MTGIYFLVALVFLPFGTVHRVAEDSLAHMAMERPQAVVWCLETSAWSDLAEEIASNEGTPLIRTWTEAVISGYEYVLWIAAPGELGDSLFVSLGEQIGNQTDLPALGVITGETMDDARELWRRDVREAGDLTAISGENPAAGIYSSRILVSSDEGEVEKDLTLEAIVEQMQRSRYLTYAGHGTSASWRFAEDERVSAGEIPELKGAVVGTASCQTLRIWTENSIALSFLTRGAAGYSGCIYSPLEGYMMGEFEGFPGRYSWPGFPMGHIIRAQTRGNLQGFARMPFHYYLGDPRNALQPYAPYRLISDESVEGIRRIGLESAVDGIIPVRIPDASGYDFVSIDGVGATSGDDPIYNKRLQVVEADGDKLLLMEVSAGSVHLELHPEAPRSWIGRHILIGALDHYLIFTPQSDEGHVGVALALVFVSVFALVSVRKKRGVNYLLASACVGLLFGAAHVAYAIVRIPITGINSKPLALIPLSWMATAMFVALGAHIFFNADRKSGKMCGVLVSTTPALVSGIVALVLIGAANMIMFKPRLGTPVYHGSLGWLPLLAAIVLFIGVYAVVEVVKIFIRRMPGQERTLAR